MGGGFRRCDLRIIGLCLSVIHCRCGYGVPNSQGMVGGGWGRCRGNWSRPRGRGNFFPTGRNKTGQDKIRQDKTGQDRTRQVIIEASASDSLYHPDIFRKL